MKNKLVHSNVKYDVSDSSMPRFNIVYSLPRINITIVCQKIMQNDCLSAVEVT